MPDLDDLPSADGIARAAGDAADLPDYAGVVRRGERRRAIRRGSTVMAAAAAVVVAIGVAQVASPGGSGRPEPAPPAVTETSPTPTTSDGDMRFMMPNGEELSSDEFFELPNVRIVHVAVDPVDLDNRAVLWELAAKDGSLVHDALAITDDGFRTRTVHPRGNGLLHLRGSTFATVEGDRSVFEFDEGRTIPIESERPSSADEIVFVKRVGTGWEIVAVDPAAEAAHRVPVPDLALSDVRSVGGRIQAIEYRPDERDTIAYHWSDDGGASWESVEVASNWWSFIVPTPAGTDHLIVESGDGATVSPFLGLHRMAPHGGGFTESPYDRKGVVPAQGAFLWEGELRFFNPVEPADDSERSGVFRFVDGRLIEVDHAMPQMESWTESGVATSDDRPVLWVADGGVLYLSADGGETWQEMPGR